MKVSVNITSDFLCPWCRIADVRLQKAITSLPPGIDVEVNWLPFELNPNMPDSGMDRRLYRSSKFGSWAYSQKLDTQTEQSAAGDGIIFNYAAIKRVPNTLAAHRLIWFTPEGNQRAAMVEHLFNAYFQDGKDIGDRQTLIDIAVENGMQRECVCDFLYSSAGETEVRQDEALARQKGITSVPSFDINGSTYHGAVPIDTLVRAIVDAHNNRYLEVNHVK